MTAILLGIRFLCELAALVALAWWEFPWGLIAAASAAVVWGTLIAPQARRRLSDPGRLAVELAVFAAATVAFVEVGQTWVAAVFAVLAAGTALVARREGV